MKNKVEIRGDIALITLNDGVNKIIVDKGDLKELEKFSSIALVEKKSGRVEIRANYQDENLKWKRTILSHHLTKNPNGTVVIHVNGDHFDFRRSNLKVVSRFERDNPKYELRNKYEIRGDYVAIFIERRNGEVLETYIDLEDLDRVKSFSNTLHVKEVKSKYDLLYVCGYRRVGTNKYEKPHLHRYILGLDEDSDLVVDHIDGNGLNNRKSNLRIATQAENVQNKRGAQANSKSGIRGVWKRSDCNRWEYQVTINGVKHRGIVKTKEEAEQRVLELRKKLLPFANV